MDRSSRFLRLAGLPVLCQVRTAKLLSEEEGAQGIAANIAKLPELLDADCPGRPTRLYALAKGFGKALFG